MAEQRAVLELVEVTQRRGPSPAPTSPSPSSWRARRVACSPTPDDRGREQLGGTLPDEILAGEPRLARGPRTCWSPRRQRCATSWAPSPATSSATTARPTRSNLSPRRRPAMPRHCAACSTPSPTSDERGGRALLGRAGRRSTDLPRPRRPALTCVRRDQSGARSVYATPVRLGHEMVGLLEVYSRRHDWIARREELALMEAAAATAALALGRRSRPRRPHAPGRTAGRPHRRVQHALPGDGR